MTGALPTGRRGQALAVALLVLVLAAAWTVVATPLLDAYADRAATLEGRAALARRMAQVAAGLPALRDAATATPMATAPGTVGPSAARLLGGNTDAVAGAALLGAVQDMAGRAGTVLSSTETLAAEPAGAYRRVGVRVALSAPWPVLIRLLRSVQVQDSGASPSMLVDDLQVSGARWLGSSGDGPLAASFVVWGFRAP